MGDKSTIRFLVLYLSDAYTERANPTVQGPITRGKLIRIQEEVKHQLTTLKDPREGHECPIVYCVTSFPKAIGSHGVKVDEENVKAIQSWPTPILMSDDKRLHVLKSSIRGLLVNETHEGRLMGHFREHKTFEILSKHFYWPHMRRDMHHISERLNEDGLYVAQFVKKLHERARDHIGKKRDRYAIYANRGKKEKMFEEDDLRHHICLIWRFVALDTFDFAKHVGGGSGTRIKDKDGSHKRLMDKKWKSRKINFQTPPKSKITTPNPPWIL
ncbi:hypothetical protein CR513_20093, partial [Mucuna pruriens]